MSNLEHRRPVSPFLASSPCVCSEVSLDEAFQKATAKWRCQGLSGALKAVPKRLYRFATWLAFLALKCYINHRAKQNRQGAAFGGFAFLLASENICRSLSKFSLVSNIHSARKAHFFSSSGINLRQIMA
jgi:hypothetical protein